MSITQRTVHAGADGVSSPSTPDSTVTRIKKPRARRRYLILFQGSRTSPYPTPNAPLSVPALIGLVFNYLRRAEFPACGRRGRKKNDMRICGGKTTSLFHRYTKEARDGPSRRCGESSKVPWCNQQTFFNSGRVAQLAEQLTLNGFMTRHSTYFH